MAFKGKDDAVKPVKDATVLNMGRDEKIQDSMLREIDSFDDAVTAAAQVHETVADFAEEYGTGFDVADKSTFVGKTILLMDWRFNSGDFGTFVSAVVYAKDGSKGIINDGSSGICEQLMEVSRESGRFGGMMVKRGLTESTYFTCVGTDDRPCGRPRPIDVEECPYCGDVSERRSKGTTHYLDLRQS